MREEGKYRHTELKQSYAYAETWQAPSQMKPKSKNRPPKNGGLFSIMGYKTYRTICVFFNAKGLLLLQSALKLEIAFRMNKAF